MKIHISFGEILLEIYAQSDNFSLKERPKLGVHTRGLFSGSAPADAPGKFVTGDLDLKRWPRSSTPDLEFSKEETNNASRNEGCEKVRIEPGTPWSVVQHSNR